MSTKDKDAIEDQQNETEEDEPDDSSKISDTRVNILQERAETRLEGQNRRIELLMGQVKRLETIKYGVLTILLLVGIYSGPEITNPPNSEIITSLIWFSIVGFSLVFSTIFSSYLGGLSRSFQFASDKESSVDSIVDELIDASATHGGERAKILDEKAEEIAEKRSHVRELEREIRFAHLILAIILISLIAFGLPSFALLNFFGPIVAI